MTRQTWACDDERDASNDRAFAVFDFDDLAAIHGGHVSIVYVLALPHGDLHHALVVDRYRTSDLRGLTCSLVAALTGTGNVLDAHGLPDRDIGRNLLNRIALYRRDHGDLVLKFAIHYGEKVDARDRVVVKPTDDMVAIARARLLEEGLDAVMWRTATTTDELPAAPHARAQFSIVGIDSRGRIHSSLPRPNHFDLDRSFGRDLRTLAQAVVGHPTFTETINYCEARGLTVLMLWRFERQRQAA